MILEIYSYGEKCLWTPTEPVTDFTEIKTLISDMTETMVAANGVGLAANQVGRTESVFVWDYNGSGHIVNPTIVEKGTVFDQIEGCLSCSDQPVKVERNSYVLLEGQDSNGEEQHIMATGLLACIFQHEYDHLNGKLLFDRLPRALRRKYIR